MGIFEKLQGVGVAQKFETVDLGRFDKRYKEAAFNVWVTPTREHVEAWGDVTKWLQQVSREAKESLARLDAEHHDQVEALRVKGDTAGVAALEQNYRAERKSFDEGTADRLQAEYDERVLRWLADTWLNVELEEARQIREHLKETNPLAWDWIVHQTHTTIGDYRKRVLKN